MQRSTRNIYIKTSQSPPLLLVCFVQLLYNHSNTQATHNAGSNAKALYLSSSFSIRTQIGLTVQIYLLLVKVKEYRQN